MDVPADPTIEIDSALQHSREKYGADHGTVLDEPRAERARRGEER
jgi:hypothetical protein